MNRKALNIILISIVVILMSIVGYLTLLRKTESPIQQSSTTQTNNVLNRSEDYGFNLILPEQTWWVKETRTFRGSYVKSDGTEFNVEDPFISDGSVFRINIYDNNLHVDNNDESLRNFAEKSITIYANQTIEGVVGEENIKNFQIGTQLAIKIFRDITLQEKSKKELMIFTLTKDHFYEISCTLDIAKCDEILSGFSLK